MRTKLKSPIGYMGGKHYTADWICNHLDYSANCYIELFGGGGSILFRKKPHRVEIFNDINDEVINFFLVLRERTDEFIENVKLLPYSRKLYSLIKNNQYETDIQKAIKFFYVVKSSFSGKYGAGWSYSFICRKPIYYHSIIDLLSLIAERLKNVQLECRHYEDILKAIPEKEAPNINIYADPPYFGTEFLYKNSKFDREDHYKLAEYFNKLNCKIIVSYYPHPEVYKLYPEPKWHYDYKQTTKYSYKSKNGNVKPRATEMLIMNYEVKNSESIFK